MKIRNAIAKCGLSIVIASLLATSAHAALHFSGTVTWMEVWRSGNVAFRLSDPASGSACNGQFILNKSDAGTKNLYAALLAAKKTGSSISVYAYDCAPAENYGGSYILVDYLYVVND